MAAFVPAFVLSQARLVARGAGPRSMWVVRTAAVLVTTLGSMCALPAAAAGDAPPAASAEEDGVVLNAAFLCVDTVYNSELMAPYDILQHTYYRDPENYVRCFIVTPDGKPFVSFEGIRITPDYSFDNCPDVDILVVPSTGTSMTDDLENEALMLWLVRTVRTAAHVVSVCDGAFPLAATSVLDGRVATTFPSDRDKLEEMFPKVDVRRDVNFVVDGKFITSVGGALSYEPALYLVEKLYSKENARRVAKGLVLDWDLAEIPHFVVERDE
ncbi:MAG: DJ-1/PfpI family protein [Candidatus Krumholzibacteriia bacterium]